MNNYSSTFAFVFLFFLSLATTLRIYLAWRQIRHVTLHRPAVPADFAPTITLQSHQKAADYTVAKVKFSVLEMAIQVIFLLWLTLGGGISFLLQNLAGIFSAGLSLGIALIASVSLLGMIIDLPFSWIRQFKIEQAFAFNRMSTFVFFTDLFKQIALSFIIGLPLLLIILYLMEKMGSLWWLYVWATMMLFSVLLMWLYPSFIAPLFNKFKPLEDSAIAERIDALLKRCDFANNGLMVMDGSKRSSHGNAYFTGFARNKRIVFFDTLLARLQPEEIEAVLAHELGHFKKKHIIQRIALSFISSLLLFFILGLLIDTPWFYQGLGVPFYPFASERNALALLLFFQVLPVFTFIFTPLSAFWSRRHEFEADSYAAAMSNSEDLIRALTKLYNDNAATLTPDPLYSSIYDSHPPAAIRIKHLRKLACSTQ